MRIGSVSVAHKEGQDDRGACIAIAARVHFQNATKFLSFRSNERAYVASPSGNKNRRNRTTKLFTGTVKRRVITRVRVTSEIAQKAHKKGLRRPDNGGVR